MGRTVRVPVLSGPLAPYGARFGSGLRLQAVSLAVEHRVVVVAGLVQPVFFQVSDQQRDGVPASGTWRVLRPLPVSVAMAGFWRRMSRTARSRVPGPWPRCRRAWRAGSRRVGPGG